MNEMLANFSMIFAFCYFLEGIDMALEKKKNNVYIATHIIYPLFIVGTIVYFRVTGVVK